MFIFPPRFSLSSSSLAHHLPLDHCHKMRKISVNESRSFTPSGQLKCRKCASFGGDSPYLIHRFRPNYLRKSGPLPHRDDIQVHDCCYRVRSLGPDRAHTIRTISLPFVKFVRILDRLPAGTGSGLQMPTQTARRDSVHRPSLPVPTCKKPDWALAGPRIRGMLNLNRSCH